MVETENTFNSDSDSSDEDAVEKMRLSEAVVDLNPMKANLQSSSNLIGEKEKEKQKDQPRARPKPQKPSLRSSKDDLRTDNAFAPGVMKFVAGKLCEELDREIVLTDCFASDTNTEIPDQGIKLFSTSSSKLLSDEEKASEPKQRKRRCSSSSDSSEENERLAEAAVSHDFIISQSKTEECVKKENGDSTSFKDNNNFKQKTVLEDNKHVDESQENETHKKKKKKKKKHKDEINVI